MTDQPILDRIIGTAETLGPLLHATPAIHQAQHAVADGYPTVASGTDNGGCSSGQRTILVDGDRVPVTSVEAAALQRLNEGGLDAPQIEAELGAALRTLRNLAADCRRIIGPHLTVPPKPRCDGGIGYDGYLTPKHEGGWSTPDCHNIPDVGRKTCPACRLAASIWKRRSGRLGATP